MRGMSEGPQCRRAEKVGHATKRKWILHLSIVMVAIDKKTIHDKQESLLHRSPSTQRQIDKYLILSRSFLAYSTVYSLTLPSLLRLLFRSIAVFLSLPHLTTHQK